MVVVEGEQNDSKNDFEAMKDYFSGRSPFLTSWVRLCEKVSPFPTIFRNLTHLQNLIEQCVDAGAIDVIVIRGSEYNAWCRGRPWP